MATTTTIRARGYRWDWLRVGAWSGSFATHVGILLLVLLPVTAPLTRPQQETIVARWIEAEPPPIAVPEPPPPAVPRRVRVTPVHASPPPLPVPATHEETPMSTPIADTPPTPMNIEPASPPSTPADTGSGGATQMLAYASPLRPRYPPASVRAGEQGTVLLRVLVDAGGVPQRVDIARSSGHARLDTAARDSVMSAPFRPVMRAGEAVPAWGVVPVEFRLDRG
jgi:periplasmic protein TonB